MRSRSGGELPQLELECLAALWALERAPVAAVHARLALRGRRLAYTTVLTVLDRMRRKQVVERERQGRAFVYRPLVSRREMRARALDRLIGNYYDSRQDLINDLVQDSNAARPASLPAAVRAPLPSLEAEPEHAILD